MHSYFKGQWPEHPVPKGEPQWMYYEVVVARDVVCRSVEHFADGRLVRASMDRAQRDAQDQRNPDFRSLVHGPFLAFARDHLTPIGSREFSALWDKAADKTMPPDAEMP